MFTAINDCYQVYRKELARYLKWWDKKVTKYSRIHKIPKKKVSIIMLSSDDISKNTIWDVELVAMGKILGLSKKEVKETVVEIIKELGIK